MPWAGPLLTSRSLSLPQWDTQLQLQVEQLLIEEHALEQQKALSSGPPEEAAFDQRARWRLLKLVETPGAPRVTPSSAPLLPRAPGVCRAGSSWALQKGSDPGSFDVLPVSSRVSSLHSATLGCSAPHRCWVLLLVLRGSSADHPAPPDSTDTVPADQL